MVRMVAAMLIAMVGWASLAGCQRKKKRTKDDQRVVKVIPTVDAPIRIISEELVEAGAKPRSLVRYQPLPTHEVTLTLTAQAALTETVDGKKNATVQLPRVTTGYQLGWRGTDARSIRVLAEPATIEPGANDKQAGALITRYETMLKGKRSELPTSERGHLGHRPIATTVPAAKTRARAYIAALADFVVPLPEVPIGIGAKWKLTRSVPRAQTTVKQFLTFELLEVKGKVLVIAIEGSLVGERQRLDASGLPPGSHVELLAMRATVKGKLHLDLRFPAATGGVLVRTDAVHTQLVRAGQQAGDYFSESTSTISLSSAKPKPAP